MPQHAEANICGMVSDHATKDCGMPLVDLDLPVDPAPLPDDVRAFLHEADRRIEDFQRDARVASFVPSDFARAFAVLRAVEISLAAPGKLFCEWGSGFGVVACVAAWLGFEAHGIEIEAELVVAARRLASDFSIPVRFLQGSFLAEPDSGTLAQGRDWELGPADFDLVFSYPWPAEAGRVESAFERGAAIGAVLITYFENGEVRFRRKVRDKRVSSTKPENRRRDSQDLTSLEFLP